MLYVILNILKIAGIIILSLLAFILLLIIALLFVPVRYKVNAIKPTVDGDFKVNITVSWLLQLFAFCFRLKNKDEQKMYIRILGIKKRLRNKDNDKPKKTKKKKKNKKNQSNDDITYTEAEDETAGSIKNESIEEDKEDNHTEDNDIVNEGAFEGDNQKKQNKFKSVVNKIEDSVVKIRKTIKKATSSVKTIKNKAQKLYSFANDGNNKKGMKKIVSSFLEILKKIKPKVTASVHFGFEDPYKMGKILSVLGILYPIYAKNTDIYPEFDNGDFYYGTVLVKGKIRIFTLLLICFKLYRDKNFKYLYNNYKEIKK